MNFRTRLIVLVSTIMATLACIVSWFLGQEHASCKQELIANNQELLNITVKSFQRNLDKYYADRLKAFFKVT